MNEEQILNKGYWSKLDKLTVLILGSISGLHDEKIKYQDMEKIHHEVASIWRKYHPIEDWDIVTSHITGETRCEK